MAAVCMLITLAAMITATGMIWKKADLVKIVLFGLFGFFGLYICVSEFLFLLDIFTIQKAILAECILAVLFLVVLLIKKRRFQFVYPRKELIVFLLICMAGVFLSWHKYEYYGMGQDQGDYQTRAIFLMGGVTENEIEFEGYTYQVAENNEGATARTFHGMPSFPAVLALWGSVFGLGNMVSVQTVFLVLFLLILYYIGGILKFKLDTKILVLLLAAVSPVILWVSKSSLTEMYLAVIMAAFIYYILDDSEKVNVWLSAFPVLVFSCYHISLYTLMPMFVVLYFMMYMYTGDRRFLIVQCFNTGSFLAGVAVIYHINKLYCISNFVPAFLWPIDQDNFLFVCVGAVAGVAAMSAALYFVPLTTVRIAIGRIRLKSWLGKGTAVAILVLLCMNLYMGRGKLGDLTLAGYLFATGFIVLPFAIALLLFNLAKRQGWIWDIKNMVITWLFFYCILVHTTFFRNEIFDYYYYSRYIVPFISILLLAFGLLFNQVCSGAKMAAGVAAAAALFPSDALLFTKLDDTRIEWDCLEETAECVDQEDAAVIVEKDLEYAFLFPLNAMSKADVYEQSGNLEEQMEALAKEYGQVYAVTNDIYLETQRDHTDVRLVYKNINHISEDSNEKEGKWIPYPVDFQEYEEAVNVYSLAMPQYTYEMKDEELTIRSGFEPLEGDFCWMGRENASISVYLDKALYKVYIHQKNRVPVEKLGTDFKVRVLMNGNPVGEVQIKEGTDMTLEFEVPAEYVEEGWNSLEFQSSLWSPSKTGTPQDERELGISVQSVEFKKSIVGN